MDAGIFYYCLTFKTLLPPLPHSLKKSLSSSLTLQPLKGPYNLPPPSPSIITSYLHSLNSSAFLQINVLLVIIGKKYRINFKNYKIVPTRKAVQYSGHIDQVPNLLGDLIQLYTHFEILCPQNNYFIVTHKFSL